MSCFGLPIFIESLLDLSQLCEWCIEQPPFGCLERDLLTVVGAHYMNSLLFVSGIFIARIDKSSSRQNNPSAACRLMPAL